MTVSADMPIETVKPRSQSRASIVVAGAVSMAVAIGVGRFAFTPLLPLMLRDGIVDLNFGSWLATANYAGYMIGALLCMALPRLWPSSALIRWGMAATAALTLGMALHIPWLWIVLRFLAGIASAVVFVFTSGWCLARLSALGAPALGGAIYTGPGAGIAASGLASFGMMADNWTAASGWLALGVLVTILSALVWPVFRGPDVSPRGVAVASSEAEAGAAPITGGSREMAVFTFTYGLAGFGYIITATFLPVIARTALPGSVWLYLFWPIFGVGVVGGALLATRIPTRIDPRLTLAICYVCQAIGIGLTLYLPTSLGFVLGSLLVGSPFNVISFLAMQEIRRLRPHHAARFMGLLTASYGLGQIAGPPMTAALLAQSSSHAQGFALSLAIASATLLIGAVLYVLMARAWPMRLSKAEL
ncbi:MAG: YbfB/YjiJ family MFS transporter [Methylocella sp.]